MKSFKAVKTALLAFSFLGALPSQALGHGAEAEHQREIATNTYFFIAWAAIFIVFLALSLRRQSKLAGKEQQGSPIGLILRWGWILSFVGLVTSGGVLLWSEFGSGINPAKEQVTLMHIHGLGYSVNGERLLIPSHHGLTAYEGGKWIEPEGDMHDYMGFSAVDDGFYSSGHPEPGTGYKEPFGIIKLGDDEKTIKLLDFHGVLDFHMLSAGFHSHAIYVFNPEANDQMAEPGLYYSLDETNTWNKSAAKGLEGGLFSMAVHPTDAATIAIGNQNGTFLSKDYGQSFQRVLDGVQATGVSFNLQGDLFVGGFKGDAEQGLEAVLLVLNLEDNKAGSIQIPALGDDAIQYMIENPENTQTWTFSTFERSVYTTKDSGKSWEQIADHGAGLE